MDRPSKLSCISFLAIYRSIPLFLCLTICLSVYVYTYATHVQACEALCPFVFWIYRTAESRCRLTCLAASSFVAPPRDFPGRALVERSPSSSSSPPTFRNGSLTRHVSLDRGVSGCVDNDKKNQSEEDLSLSACVAKKEKNAGKKGRSAAEASVNVSSQGLASSSSKQERNQKAEGGDKGSLLPRKEHGRARDPQTKDRREQGEGSLIAKEMSGAPGVHTLHQKGMKRKKGESGVSFQKKQKRKLFMQNGGNSSL